MAQHFFQNLESLNFFKIESLQKRIDIESKNKEDYNIISEIALLKESLAEVKEDIREIKHSLIEIKAYSKASCKVSTSINTMLNKTVVKQNTFNLSARNNTFLKRLSNDSNILSERKSIYNSVKPLKKVTFKLTKNFEDLSEKQDKLSFRMDDIKEENSSLNNTILLNSSTESQSDLTVFDSDFSL